MSKEITTVESKRLVTLEKTISKGEKIFIEVGLALAEIRDAKLYRENHDTFEDYCREKWGWGRQRGYELIYAAKAVNELPENVIKKITNEGQASALMKVPPPKRAAVIKQAAANGKLTAASIKRASPPPKNIVPEIEKDKEGYPIPQGILPYWQRSFEVRELLTSISFVRGKLKKFEADGDILFSRADFSALKANLSQAYADIENCKPYTVCPYCSGKLPKQCGECNKTGFVSEFQWKHSVPEEIKKLRA